MLLVMKLARPNNCLRLDACLPIPSLRILQETPLMVSSLLELGVVSFLLESDN